MIPVLLTSVLRYSLLACSNRSVDLLGDGVSDVRQVKVLNDGGDFPSNAEVVVAPPAIFLQTVKDNIRSDIKASIQPTNHVCRTDRS